MEDVFMVKKINAFNIQKVFVAFVPPFNRA